MFEKRKIYVAGKWEDREIIRDIHKVLTSNGYAITCDWTYHTKHVDSVKRALEDINGVRQCELLIAYMKNEYAYKGVWAEIGAALALYKQVIVIGDKADACIFINRPFVTRVNTVQKAISILRCCE